jgi:nicotinamidase-related amidase
MALLKRDSAALVVVDVQEGFRPYDSFAAVAAACAKLLAAARILDVPALVSEQYPKGLGHSAPELGLQDEPRIEKTVFSAVRADGFDRSKIGGTQPGGLGHARGQAIVCGIETHVCVSQTVHDLLDRGIDNERGLERLQRAGAVVSTVETALFELLGQAGTPEFKSVQKLIL